jgi:hypothetical protein
MKYYNEARTFIVEQGCTRTALSGPGTFFAGQCWADYTISMSGFDLRQAQGTAVTN